jgi:transcriptional regulator with XRE-family HTH domain
MADQIKELVDVGLRLRTLRNLRSLTQEQLGGLIGLTAAGLRKIEKAQSNFRVLTLVAILRELRGSADEALGFTAARGGRLSFLAERIASKFGALDDDLQKVAETVVAGLALEQEARIERSQQRGHPPAAKRPARQAGSTRKRPDDKPRRRRGG